MKKAPLTTIKNLLKEEKPNRQWYPKQSDIELQNQKRFINLKTEEKFPSSSVDKNFPFGWCLLENSLTDWQLAVSSQLAVSNGSKMTILGDPGAVSRAGRRGATKVFKHRRKSPWVPTLTGPFPNGSANAGSWLGTKNALYYCAQSANSISWVPLVSSYTTAIDSITACLAHAPKKCTQSGIFQFDINATFQNTGSLYTRA